MTEPRPRALVVDDEPQILMIMRFALETQGFDCDTAADGATAWEEFRSGHFDLVVLDLMIPVVSGVVLCQRIRAVSEVPVIMITALGQEADRVRGLEAGADDYITKPFSPREFALRAQGLVRRWRGGSRGSLTNGPLVIDVQTHRVLLDGEAQEMSSTEVRFLESLVRHLGEDVSYRQLLNEVWATADQAGGKDMIKTTAYRVRKVLGPRGPALVQSVRGVGYRMPVLPPT
ncbi:MAG: response regulator transcription factor [Actinomyces sp.]|nr:response regulator transcription factor [Propionibacterium sp.]MDN6565962.1 response regulator transcription factor [Actinomyces sp.]